MKRHNIIFRRSAKLTILPAPGSRTVTQKNLNVRKGDRMHVVLKPYVRGGIELCDLTLPDGSVIAGVPYAKFTFL